MLKIVFLGTPDFSVKPLESIYQKENVKIVGVVCNKDKPVGRKRIITAPPVKQRALELGLNVLQYDKIKTEGVEDLKSLKPDLMVTCAFGQILSQEILDIAPLGVINVHASLLPKYRGASPIQACLLAGEKETGVTIMKTDIGIDTGDIIYQEKLQIEEEDNAGSLFEKLSVLGAKAVSVAIDKIIDGTAEYKKQGEDFILTKMVKKEDAFVDFNKTAEEVINMIRAYSPFPTAYTLYNGEPFKIYKAELCEKEGDKGTVIESGKNLIVACKEKSIKLLIVQKFGGKVMPVQDFLRGNAINLGTELGK